MKTINFAIDKKEALRYAGHKAEEISPQLNEKFEKIYKLCQSYIKPNYALARVKICNDEKAVRIENTDIVLPGEDIKKHLDGCNECYILCATAGFGADGFIRSMQGLDTVSGLFADGCCTRAVESYCDAIEKELRAELKKENKFLTRRYSPGYGDFPFTIQPEILRLLNTEKTIGVTCNESCIMSPSKSVTAIMGIANKKPTDRQTKCQNCPNRENCDFSCR